MLYSETSRIVLTLLGHYDTEFSKKKDFYLNMNTLKNTKNYLRDIHFLDKGGDI